MNAAKISERSSTLLWAFLLYLVLFSSPSSADAARISRVGAMNSWLSPPSVSELEARASGNAAGMPDPMPAGQPDARHRIGQAGLDGAGVSQVGLIDTRGPEFLSVEVDRPVVGEGETVVITVTTYEPLPKPPRVAVNGVLAQLVDEDGAVYTYTFTALPPLPPGPARVTVDGTDGVGNGGTYVSTTILELDTPPLPLHTALVFAVFVLAAWFALRRAGRRAALLLPLGLLASLVAHAADPVVTNVSFAQQARSTGGTEVIITYDLDTPGPSDIKVWLSKSAGADGFPYPVTSITGDIEDVTSGTGRRIVWNVAADYPDAYIPQAQLKVTASAYDAWEQSYQKYTFENMCQVNLARLGKAIRDFMREPGHFYYPQFAAEPGVLMFREEDIFPAHLCDRRLVRCPNRADYEDEPVIDDDHYVYLGYGITCDEDAVAFADAYWAEVAAGGDFSGDLPGATSYGDTFYRLNTLSSGTCFSPGYDINDPSLCIPSRRVPLMLEWPDNHQPGWGGNVLFLDGHVEFCRYPEEFPMTEATIGALAGIAGYEPPTTWREPDYDSPYGPTNDPHGFVADCRNHMLIMGLVTQMFGGENDGPLPPLSLESGRLMMEPDSIYPEYLQDPDVLVCPGVSPDLESPYMNDRDYVYWGYLLLDDADAAVFAAAYADEMAAGGDFTGDLPGPTSYGDTLYRLHEDIAMVVQEVPCGVLSEEAPIMLEWPDNHENRSGGHVLYLDGHVEWHDYPGEFPMTETMVATLGAMAGRTPKTAWAEPEPAYEPENDPHGLVAECRDHCKGLGLALKMISNESMGEMYPMLSAEPGRLMFTEEDMYSYLQDHLEYLICPGPEPPDPAPFFDDQNYVYLGYVVTNESDMTAFADAYTAEMAGARDFSGDLPATVTYGAGDALLRLRGGIQYTIVNLSPPGAPFIGNHEIPVIVEWPDQHEGLSGGHVLYEDGHVEWHDYPGEFPMSESAIADLERIAGWTRTTAYNTPAFSPNNDPHKQALCAFSMRMLALCLHVFGNYQPGKFYPPLSSTPGTLMFSSEDMLPYYLDEPRRLHCPGSAAAFAPLAVDDQSYAYLGYVVTNEAELQAFADAYTDEMAGARDFSGDLPGTVGYGAGDAISRLRHLVVRDIHEASPPEAEFLHASRIPVLIEWPDNHSDLRGGNVLYFDRHTEWLDYPGEFPMSEAAMDILTALAGRPPID